MKTLNERRLDSRKKVCLLFLTFFTALLTAAFIGYGTFGTAARTKDPGSSGISNVNAANLQSTTLQEDANAEVFDRFDALVRAYAGKNSESVSAADLDFAVKIATERREALKDLMKTSPKAAFERTIRAEDFKKLPSFMTDNSEKYVSAYGDFLVYAIDDFNKNGSVSENENHSSIRREVIIGGTRYEALVYGRREAMTTKFDIPIQGVLLDGTMLVDESPLRKVSPAEYKERARGQNAGKTKLAAEVGGQIVAFPSEAQLNSFASEEILWESKIGARRPNAKTADQSFTPQTANSAYTEGAKTILAVRLDFSDAPGEPVSETGTVITPAAIDSLFANQVNPFFVNNSYSKTSVTAIVQSALVRMPKTLAYYSSGTTKAAKDALEAEMLNDLIPTVQAAGYNTNNYNFVTGFFTDSAAISFYGLARVGDKPSLITGEVSLRVSGHELGHNYGLYHAQRWVSNDSNPVGAGNEVEYGDYVDLMGSGFRQEDHFNAAYKRRLDWLTDQNFPLLTTSGDYTIYPNDDPSPSGYRGLKIQKGNSGDTYTVEFRQSNSPYYTSLPDGALVRWVSGAVSRVVDMTPGDGNLSNSPLYIGQTYNDTAAGVSITVVSKNTSPQSLTVHVTIPQFCTYALSEAGRTFPGYGGSGSFDVITQPGCPWTATPGTSWFTITSGSSGNGPGTVTYDVSPNSYGFQRGSSISVTGGLFYGITQLVQTASIYGQVRDGNGNGIPNITLTISDNVGNQQQTTTNTYGYYQFLGYTVGNTYTITPSSTNYTFNPVSRTFNLTGELIQVDFIAKSRVRIQF